MEEAASPLGFMPLSQPLPPRHGSLSGVTRCPDVLQPQACAPLGQVSGCWGQTKHVCVSSVTLPLILSLSSSWLLVTGGSLWPPLPGSPLSEDSDGLLHQIIQFVSKFCPDLHGRGKVPPFSVPERKSHLVTSTHLISAL